MKRFLTLLSRHRSEWLLLMLFTVLPLLSSSAVILLVLNHGNTLAEMSRSGWIFLFILISVPIAFSLIPNTLAGLLAGYFAGWAGLAGMTVSFSLACIWGYFLGRIAGKNLLKDVIQIWPKLERHISAFRNNPGYLVSGLRLLPAPPFAIGSLILVWLGVPFRTYFTGSIAGMLPRMALVVFASSMARNLEELLRNKIFDYRIFASMLILALLGLFMILRYFRKSRTR